MAILDRILGLQAVKLVYSGNYLNDETLIAIENPTIAAHYEREFSRLYKTAVVGLESLPDAQKCKVDVLAVPPNRPLQQNRLTSAILKEVASALSPAYQTYDPTTCTHLYSRWRLWWSLHGTTSKPAALGKSERPEIVWSSRAIASFSPLLYELLTGELQTWEIAPPLKSFS